MDDHATLIGTGILTVFFLIAGIINILDNPVIKGILFVGFITIVVSIIVAQSRKDEDKKNPPE